MEKKNNSVRQTLSKSLVSEGRKSQETTKQWPRNGRRRETTNHTNSKPEPIRSTNKQFTSARNYNNFDKRLRRYGDGYQRSVGSSAALSFAPGTGLDDDQQDTLVVEMNSVYAPGSKKQNLNHLLNFNYAPRERTDPAQYSRFGNYHHRYHSLKKNRYNKEHFLQATCQFVVNANFDYEVYKGCPDTLVEWNFIEQINIQTAEEPQCPICLYPPVAAKMTRCGHVYCWPCILQYLSLSDKAWRKCPICYEAIQVGYLRSTISKPYQNYSVGDYVTLQLMCREKGSLYVAKVNKAKTKYFPHLSDDAENQMHSKLILANVEEIMTIIERENIELNRQLEFDGLDCPESVFIQQALVLLQERQQQMNLSLEKCENKIQNPIKNQIENENAFNEMKMEQLKLNAAAKPFAPTIVEGAAAAVDLEKSSDFVIDEESNLTLQDIDITPMAKDSNHFFFYQASDGQHLYLHSINVRMLQLMYGSLDRAPHTIRGKIVQKESCSMTEDLRKRLKYLQHLPVTSQFDVVEIGLEQPIVSAEILAKFKDELMLRQKTRQRRAREELKREKHINEVNDRQIGKLVAQSANIDVTSDRQFPSCGSFELASNFRDDPALSPASSDLSGPTDSSVAAAGPSFATMLSGPTKAQLWPSLGPTKNLAFDVKPLAKTRENIVRRAPRQQSYNSDLDEQDDDDENGFHKSSFLSFKTSFGSAIAEALIVKTKTPSIALTNQPTTPITINQTGGNHPSNGKKKKIKQKTILFSTSARPFDGK